MHVAAWHRQTPPNNEKCCGDPTRSKISVSENVCSPKKWTKIHKNCLRPVSLIMPNFIEIGETTLEKCYKFFTPFNILAPPWSNVPGLGGGVSPLDTCKISSHSDDPFPRYLLSNFFYFVAGMTTKKTQKTYSKRYLSALLAVTKRQRQKKLKTNGKRISISS